MRYSAEHKAASREALVKAAARSFRERGFSAVGVDMVSAEAGVTSGSFYKHFTTKSEALREVLRHGVDRIAKRVRTVRGAPDVDSVGGWINDYATLQTSAEHRACTARGCNLPSLSAEVARAGDEVRRDYEEAIRRGVAEMLDGDPFAGEADGRARALAFLAILAGGTTIARAVADPELADEIGEAVRRAALLIAENRLPDVPRSKAVWAPID